MTDQDISKLADLAGIAVEWTDDQKRPHRVAPDVLRNILGKLGFPCDTQRNLANSLRRLNGADGAEVWAPLYTGSVGEPIALSAGKEGSKAKLTLETGETSDLKLAPARNGRLTMPAIDRPGYHRLEIGDKTVTLAVAPLRCFGIEDIAPGERLWGIAAQLYGIRRPGDGGIGDMGGVAELATGAAQYGADALALSPSHALFAADPAHFGPYSPSSRLFLNPLHADPALLFGTAYVEAAKADIGGMADPEGLIDYPRAAQAKLRLFRRLFEKFCANGLEADNASSLGADFGRFQKESGDLLEEHARFEALHAARFGADTAQRDWRDWADEFRDPHGPAVADFARKHSDEILFHKFLQWLADRSLEKAQSAAREAGMRIGLIADLAVGTDPAGSHAWSRQGELVGGLGIGAPPDFFNPLGQNWSLTAFSPHALISSGFSPFLATLRAAMRHAGGVRIDHAMGLARLWLVPEGASPGDGAFLRYPYEDMMRLIALESVRHEAIVIGEDLGTVPEGFSEKLNAAGILSMRVLWFERDKAGKFSPPEDWTVPAAAMTSTHDLPGIAGWWAGSDIALRASLGLLGEGRDGSEASVARAEDRHALWAALSRAEIIAGPEPGPDGGGDHMIDAALRFVARTPSLLALFPLEDVMGLEDQPNLPGTIDEHPNWRRRMALPADEILDQPEIAARLTAVKRERLES